MSPISVVTYRIQSQTLNLNLNTVLERKKKRAAALRKPKRAEFAATRAAIGNRADACPEMQELAQEGQSDIGAICWRRLSLPGRCWGLVRAPGRRPAKPWASNTRRSRWLRSISGPVRSITPGLSAQPDGTGQGWEVFDLADGHGVAPGEAGRSEECNRRWEAANC